MGAPAVITVTDHTGQSRRFYGHWASPQYQIPHLAEFIHQADTDHTPLTVAAYLAYVAVHPNTLPGEDITGQGGTATRPRPTAWTTATPCTSPSTTSRCGTPSLSATARTTASGCARART